MQESHTVSLGKEKRTLDSIKDDEVGIVHYEGRADWADTVFKYPKSDTPMQVRNLHGRIAFREN